MSTIRTVRRADPEPHHIDGAETCANGHPWTPSATRWRYRDRGGRHGSGWERDCLTCKDAADKTRARSRADAQHQQLIVTVTGSGTHWGTRGDS